MAEFEPEILHASCVTLGSAGVLIYGASGTGKSGLALQLMAFGAELVADDRVKISRKEGQIVAQCPKSIRGRIEARGVGILVAETAAAATIHLVVDMDTIEDERLPEHHLITLIGVDIPLIRKSDAGHFPAAVLQYLKGARSD